MKSKLAKYASIGGASILAGGHSLLAQTAAPLDLTSTGTTVAGYVATAAGCGVAILAAMYGVRIIVRAFKAVK